MFDKYIYDVFETYMHVIHESKKDIRLKISNSCVDLTVFEDGKVTEMYYAFLFNDTPEFTENSLARIEKILTSFLESEEVNV